MKIKSQILIFLGILVVTLIISGAFLSFFISEKIYAESLQHFIDLNAYFIQSTALLVLNSNDFSTENYDQKQTIFSNFFENVDTSEILRIKVWGLDGTIIYSDNKNLVGQNFVDNANFKSSLTGQITAEIKEPEKPENVAEKGYGQLMEIYVPITFDNKVSGIIETYISLDSVNESVDNTNKIISAIVLITLFGVTVFLIMIYFLIKKNIISPIIRLQDHTKQISSQDIIIMIKPEGGEEIQNLTRDVNRMSKELIVQRDNLIKKEKLTAIGELSSRIAHDIRNPLSVIKTSLANMRTAKDIPQNFEQSMDRCDRAIDRIAHQVEGVMDFLKASELHIESINLKEMFESIVIDIVQSNEVRVNLPKNESSITGDRIKLHSLFYNLITNAVQAMENKGIITIRISDKSNNEIQIEVEDDGPPIPEDDLVKIFEPLFTTKQVGTGLGLASCRKIVEQHNGSISVQNNPTTFTVILPLRNPNLLVKYS